MLAVGVVVGTGIFAVPGYVAATLGAPGPILLAWLLGGALTLAGALTYAELGSRLPQQGGSFVYVLHAFGPFAAFFKGWGAFLVGYPASCAVVATILGSYFAAALEAPPSVARAAAFVAATLAWLLNLRGTRFSGTLQTVLTLLKVAAIATLAVLALAVGPGQLDRLTLVGAGWPKASAFAAAMVGVLWTFDGWANLNTVAGEVRDPRRGLRRALIGTAVVVAALYLLVNVGYLVLLPFDQLAGSDSAASAAAETVLGPAGGRVIAAIVVVSAFGTLFGIWVAGPRYFYAMARHGLFFAAAGQVTRDGSTPRWGATALYVLTLAYLLTGSFSEILGFYVAISLVYGTLAIAAVYRLRAKRIGEDGGYRVPGYPVTPALVIAAALWVTGSEIVASPVRTGIGLAMLVLALPAYRWWRRREVTSRR
ncbi:MAG: amino acid permease [Gemmatimonadetes bacterium]|nr:amino acid permease [Gemmatimonadota bacterium]